MKRVLIVEATTHYDEGDDEAQDKAERNADKIAAYAERLGFQTFSQDDQEAMPGEYKFGG